MPPRARARSGATYGVLALTDTLLAAAPPGWSRLRRVTKPLLMPALTAGLLSEGSGAGARGVVAGQALSWVGDVALLGKGRGPLLTGLAAFLAAHVSYVAAFRGRSSQPLLATAGRRRLLATCAVSTAGIALAAGRTDRTLVGPVAAYGATLAVMVASAAAVDTDRGRAPTLAGASLFLVSDTLLGLRLFVIRDDSPALEAAVMATYTAGQWLIGAGALEG
jgi:uncharacterized membrane protein YhhN